MIILQECFDEIKKHAEMSYPNECCGVLLQNAASGTVTEIRSMVNLADPDISEEFFYMDPLELYKVEKEAAEKELMVYGFYHAHPDNEAVPSDEDRSHMIPGVKYMIIAVDRGLCTDVNVFEKKRPEGGLHHECVYFGNAERLF